MALFKILKGNSSNLSSQAIREGYCYVTTDEHKMYIDTSTERFALNAKQADQLNPNLDTGSSTIPVYFDSGKPKSCVSDFVFFDELENAGDNVDINLSFVSKTGDEMTGNLSAPLFIGPLQGNATTASSCTGNSATATKLATERTISLTGDVTGSGTFDGSNNLSITTTRTSPALPTGGTAGQLLIKNSSTDGDASWKNSTYLPLSGGTMTGQIISNSKYAYTGTGAVIDTLTSSNYNTGLILDVGMNGSGIFRGNGDNATTGIDGSCNLIIKSWYGVGFATSCYNITNPGITLSINTRTGDLKSIGSITATTVYGAVWNDYAEYRICKENFKSGQVVYENGDDTLSISTERLQRGCSIVSDTFGFAIGETNKAKCPIAVSGRVLAYGYEDREEFKKHIGWPVCSGPNGTVSIMTEEEEEKYPSRIIGTISAVPDYETWGTGNVQINNRIWIKVR